MTRDGDETNVTAVRPLNHVESEPVIRRIGDRSRYPGNARAADPEHHDRSFAHVLSPLTDPRPLTTHHYPSRTDPATTGGRSRRPSVRRANSTAARSVLVNCRAGVYPTARE